MANLESAFVSTDPWVTVSPRLVSARRVVLALAYVLVDVTPGPVSIEGLHLDHTFAADVCAAQAERARLARTRDTSVHWANPEIRL